MSRVSLDLECLSKDSYESPKIPNIWDLNQHMGTISFFFTSQHSFISLHFPLMHFHFLRMEIYGIPYCFFFHFLFLFLKKNGHPPGICWVDFHVMLVSVKISMNHSHYLPFLFLGLHFTVDVFSGVEYSWIFPHETVPKLEQLWRVGLQVVLPVEIITE